MSNSPKHLLADHDPVTLLDDFGHPKGLYVDTDHSRRLEGEQPRPPRANCRPRWEGDATDRDAEGIDARPPVAMANRRSDPAALPSLDRAIALDAGCPGPNIDAPVMTAEALSAIEGLLNEVDDLTSAMSEAIEDATAANCHVTAKILRDSAADAIVKLYAVVRLAGGRGHGQGGCCGEATR